MNYNEETVTAVIVGTVVYLVVLAALYVWVSVALSKVFAKFGIPAWKAWVPFVNTIELLRLGGYDAWNIVWFFIPILSLYGVVLTILSVHRINQRFGLGAGMTVLGALVFPVWASVLGFGQRQLLGTADRRFADAAASALGGQPPAVKSALNPFGISTAQPVGPIVSAPTGFHPSMIPAPPTSVSQLPEPPISRTSIAEMPSFAQSVTEPAVAPQNPWARVVSPTTSDAPQQPATTIAAPPASVSPEPGIAEVAPVAPVASVMPPLPAPASLTPPVPQMAAPVTPTAVNEGFDADDDDDRTIVVNRKPIIHWTLVSSTGERLPLTGDEVVLGRKPTAADGVSPLAVPDPTKTLSRVHARLSRLDDVWTITDLNATNGVVVIDSAGAEKVLAAGASAAVVTSFILGQLRLSIEFDAAGTTQ